MWCCAELLQMFILSVLPFLCEYANLANKRVGTEIGYACDGSCSEHYSPLEWGGETAACDSFLDCVVVFYHRDISLSPQDGHTHTAPLNALKKGNKHNIVLLRVRSLTIGEVFIVF